MVRVLKNGLMVQSMREITKTERRILMAALHLLMEVIIQDNSKTMKSQDLVNTFGPMVKCMKVSGRKTKCMVKELWFGVMVSNMKATS
jgi:hypothetical protein